MKKIFSLVLILLGGMSLLSSCEEDRDSNPTLVQPTEFVMNETNWRGALVDLENTSDSLLLSWSQPTYATDGAPVLVNYSVDFSPKGTFTTAYDEAAEDNTGADYATLATGLNNCTYKTSAEALNRLCMAMFGWTSANQLPAQLVGTFRVRAGVPKSTNELLNPIMSNEITVKMLPYFMILKAADPEIWWLIGADIADGSWGSDMGKCVIPMQTIENATYSQTTGQGKIQWVGYLAGGGFKLRGALDDGWASQWGQGASFGEFVKNDGGSGNIAVPSAGIYTVTLYTDADLAVKEGKQTLNVEPFDGTPAVRAGMSISGSFNGWSDTEMTPCSTGWENHDWYIQVDLNVADEIKIKETGTWDYNSGGQLVEREDGFYTYGVQNGDNIWIPKAATYLILYNDITRYIRFIKIEN